MRCNANCLVWIVVILSAALAIGGAALLIAGALWIAP